MNPERPYSDVEAARRCARGELLADEVPVRARELAVTWLHELHLTDAEIGARVGLTAYSAARVRARLNLPARRVPEPSPEVVPRGA